ncbi:MAG TPA: DUF6230 family protein [Solirubrobacteraceae bacterium]|nr:DUF6230 family protein [Solirubrobacteraceae bacterium]
MRTVRRARDSPGGSMSESVQGAPVVGRTRWRRFGIAAGAGLGALGIVGYLAASGALALSFAFSGIPFRLSAKSLTGTNFVQYAYPDSVSYHQQANLQGAAQSLIGTSNPINNVIQTGASTAVVSDTVSQFRSANIDGLNQRVCANLPGGLPGAMQVVIAGTGQNTEASNLVIQAPALAASSAKFGNITIGKSLGDALNSQGFAANNEFTDPYHALSDNSATLGGSFAQSANSAVLTDIQQIGIGTEAGSFTIDGLKLYAEFVTQCS